MTEKPKRKAPGRLRDSQYNRCRTILGIRVLVNAAADADGLVKNTLPVRIKFHSGDVDYTLPCLYYWQAFNDAKARIRAALP